MKKKKNNIVTDRYLFFFFFFGKQKRSKTKKKIRMIYDFGMIINKTERIWKIKTQIMILSLFDCNVRSS